MSEDDRYEAPAVTSSPEEDFQSQASSSEGDRRDDHSRDDDNRSSDNEQENRSRVHDNENVDDDDRRKNMDERETEENANDQHEQQEASIKDDHAAKRSRDEETSSGKDPVKIPRGFEFRRSCVPFSIIDMTYQQYVQRHYEWAIEEYQKQRAAMMYHAPPNFFPGPPGMGPPPNMNMSGRFPPPFPPQSFGMSAPGHINMNAPPAPGYY